MLDDRGLKKRVLGAQLGDVSSPSNNHICLVITT